MKSLISILLFLVCCTHAVAQDSTVKRKFSLPKGLSYTAQSFFAKSPDVEAFEVVRTRENNPEYATGYGYTFKVHDSIKIPVNIFGFFDGNDMYVRIDRGVRRRNNGSPNGWAYTVDIREFFKLAKPGRHAYIVTYTRNFLSPARDAVVVEDSLFTQEINHLEIYYLSKKKELINATPTGIGFLLKKDKDLYEAYQNEKAINKVVMRKYLDKMNDRYPDWEPETK